MSQLSYKAISIRDPWARAIFCGKDVENRSWYTNYRGLLLVHCGLTASNDDSEIDRLVAHIRPNLGAVIGLVTLVDCVTNARSKWAQRDSYHLVLASQVLLSKPFPYRGKLNLFSIYGTEIPSASLAEIKQLTR